MAMSDFDDPDLDAEDDNIAHTYLTFAVADEEFALPVANVTEIVRLQRIFAVPDVPSHIRGVINLRGKVIPLLDVRARFGVTRAPYDDRTVVVVIEVDEAPTGLVVDAVFDIAEIPPEATEPAPATTRAIGSSTVTSMSKRGDRVTFIVDVPRLVGPAFTPPEPTRNNVLSREGSTQ